jgi:hypothetical protein
MPHRIKSVLRGAALVLAVGSAVFPACIAAADDLDSVISYPTAPAPAATKTQVDGTFVVQIGLKAAASLPDGTPVTFSIAAQTFDSAFSNEASTVATAMVSHGAASITVNVPYTWTVASTDNTVSISVQVSAFVQDGSTSYSNLTDLDQTIPLPADGAKTKLNFHSSI